MGYWGHHPMEGDSPSEDVGSVKWWLLETLIADIQSEESAGKNEKISDYLRNFVIERNFDIKQIDEDFFYENYDFDRERELWNTYKYDVINHFKDERTDYEDNSYFVIPFTFIEMDIHVKSRYVPYLVEMLEDGGSTRRGYEFKKCINKDKEEYRNYILEDFKEDHCHPYYYVLLVEKYANQLFDESNNELNDEFVAQHPEIRNVISKGLLETLFMQLEGNSGLMNVD